MLPPCHFLPRALCLRWNCIESRGSGGGCSLVFFHPGLSRRTGLPPFLQPYCLVPYEHPFLLSPDLPSCSYGLLAWAGRPIIPGESGMGGRQQVSRWCWSRACVCSLCCEWCHLHVVRQDFSPHSGNLRLSLSCVPPSPFGRMSSESCTWSFTSCRSLDRLVHMAPE
jgi:hypothetical protein